MRKKLSHLGSPCFPLPLDETLLVYVLGDQASTHPKGVASAVFPNLYSTSWWKPVHGFYPQRWLTAWSVHANNTGLFMGVKVEN